MKKALAFVLGFVLTLAMAELGVRALADDLPSPESWPSIDTEVKDQQIRVLSETGTEIEVVLLGSSVTEAAVDPDLWLDVGVSAYNAAIPYGTLLALETWGREFVIPRLDPEVVVIGTSLWYPNHTADSDPFRSALTSILERRYHRSVTNWPWDQSQLWERRGQLKYLPASLAWRDSTRVPLWTPLGHQSGYARGAVEAVELRNRGVRGDPADNIAALGRLLADLQDDGKSAAVMIEPAQCPPAFAVCDDEGLDEFVALLTATARNAGVPVIDAREFATTPDMFADTAHFNRKGTVAFSQYVMDRLVGLGVLSVG